MKLRTTTPASSLSVAMRVVVIASLIVTTVSLPMQYLSSRTASAVTCNTSSECDAKIEALRSKSADYEREAAALSKKSDSLATAVSKIANEVSAVQVKIDLSEAEHQKLSDEIKAIETRISENKETSGRLIVSSSLSSDVPLIVRLASSSSLADYIDGEASRMQVRDTIVEKTEENEQLKSELVDKKEKVEKVLTDQKQQQNQLASKQAEQQRLLDETKGNESAYRSMISKSSKEIESLRAQQIEINSVFIPNYTPGTGPACGGGYPAKWCNIAMDSVADDWGMYNRECVSYTAFKVASSGRNMPYWGGIGNAYEWDDNARSAGIPVNGTPKVGAIGQTDAGPYGHVFHVDSINSDGTINISQYNAAFDGRYSTATISPVGYNFIHF